VVDIQRFLPCKIRPIKLSFWEEIEVKKKIDMLIALRKMKPSTLEYACKVTLLVKKVVVGGSVEITNHSVSKHIEIHFWASSRRCFDPTK